MPVSASAGIGLRLPHHADFLAMQPLTGWVEVHSENYLSGPALAVLERVRADYPVSLHGVGLSLGSASGVDDAHLERLRVLADRIGPFLVSEHLAWTGANGVHLADLLPLPLHEESLEIFCRNVEHAQDVLKRQILVENPMTYLQFPETTISEPDFLAEVSRRTGCGLICDINNIFVSAHNHGWDAQTYLRALPREAVAEYHLAGHMPGEAESAGLLLDTHDRAISPAVWALFDEALRIIGPRPVMIERDARLPALSVLLEEAALAQTRLDAQARSAGDVLVA
ncbi:MAG: DUF692 domain-containing protein [Rhodospirillales bacterium]|nr:DUF692 domain-containing protein [Rhodospirillales bacterium]